MMLLPNDHPALVRREITEQTEYGFVIVETWNANHPDCPVKLYESPPGKPLFREIYSG